MPYDFDPNMHTEEQMKERITELETKLAAVTAELDLIQDHLDATIDILEQTRTQLAASEARVKELEGAIASFFDGDLESATTSLAQGMCLHGIKAVQISNQLAAHQEALRVAVSALEDYKGVLLINGGFDEDVAGDALAKIEELTT